MSTLVIADGQNLVNDAGRELVRTGIATNGLRNYFRDWFDVDRLVGVTLADHEKDPRRDLGTIIFHSRKQIGSDSSDYRVHANEAQAFWARQGAAAHTSTILLEIPGARKGKGKEKGNPEEAESDADDGAPTGRDYGMDVGIAVYLLETSARWDTAILFTGDTDLVPAVWSLRRQGKRIFCALPKQRLAVSPLVHACQSSLPLSIEFLRADYAFFRFLSNGGVLDEFIAHELGRGLKTIEFNSSGVIIDSVSSQGSAQNTINEMFRREKLWLYASPHGSGGLHVAGATHPGEYRNELLRGEAEVAAGALRRVESLPDWAWRKALRLVEFR